MFEIEGQHIAELNDEDLRTLVARLCEAELHSKSWPISAVTAGGDQNAPDGGLDVRVELAMNLQDGDFIPKSKTGFQVKLPDMGPSAIKREMLPHGTLRQVISDLARESGAYIIVSAQGSTADSALSRRKEAMYEALSDDENKDSLTLDFYDRNRVASWVRCYPGLAVWVRERIGRPYNEWYPYSNWAEPDKDTDAEYFSDDKCRFVDEQCPRDGELNIEEGINRIRSKLAVPKECVRLVGLSGTGKTRLAQALFDSRVGEEAIDQAIVVYTDLGRSPDPTPTQLISDLIQQSKRAIVIIDNCPPETHSALATACSVANSKISLMTIEYDVGDDTPERTEVFRLHASSEGIIESILATHAPNVSQVDRRHIAELSDGNARIALALAHTVDRGESVTNLSNRELFNRLFHQRRQQNDDSLLRAAEALALVYSFDGETLNGDGAELPLLASIANQSADDLYRNVTELVDRELVQKRSKWRALLPQALANRLAHQSMEKMHPEIVSRIFTLQAPERLLKSFSRRLGYLHESGCAQKVVGAWLSETGYLTTHMHNFSELGTALFQNIAPVSPDKTLSAIERTIEGENSEDFISLRSSHRSTWVGILRSLSYEAAFFERASKLLIEFARVETPNNNTSSARNTFIELFHLYLSGTHASHHQRLDVIKALFQSGEEADQKLRLEALDAMLEAWHFSSNHTFTFGAHSRDHGWEPSNSDEVRNWYEAAVELATELAISDRPYSEQVKTILANNVRGMIIRAEMLEPIDKFTDSLLADDVWIEGWKAVRETISLDADTMPSEKLERLLALEKRLRPQTLKQRINAYLKSQNWGHLNIEDGEPVDDTDDVMAPYNQVEKTANQLGREAIASPDFSSAILPDLFCGSIGSLAWTFGRGLASGSENLADVWGLLIATLAAISSDTRDTTVIRGFLFEAHEINAKQTNIFLDSALNRPDIGSLFPELQSAVQIDQLGAERLEKSIDFGLTPARSFQRLVYGGVHCCPVKDFAVIK